MAIRVDHYGIDCLRATFPVLSTTGARIHIVVVPNDAANEPCSDGNSYDCKVITFADGKAISVTCITRTDLARLRVFVADIQATLDILPTLPASLATAISCPPPFLTTEEHQERLDGITRWMREEYKSRLSIR